MELIPFSFKPLLETFIEQAQKKESQKKDGYCREYKEFEIKVSFGQGNFARIPWIAFLAKGQEVSHGIYPVILYYRYEEAKINLKLDELILAYGISEEQKPANQWKFDFDSPKTIKEYFLDKYEIAPKSYGSSYYTFSQQVSAGIDYEQFEQEWNKVIDVYRKQGLSSEKQESSSPLKPPIQDILQEPPASFESSKPYSLEEALKDLFIPKVTVESIIKRLLSKKNVILQGPPGVGKTFVARKLADLIMGEQKSSRVEMVQFHQSYNYEDFVQGYRPDSSGFSLKDGIFYQFCEQAAKNPIKKHVFIIDEINRANLSKVFGEIMMLIEHDKRGKHWSIPLTYSEKESEKFYIPENVYIIGLMNTADRSLAVVDYALRRRFSFIDIEPAFDTEEFRQYLIAKGAEEIFVRSLCNTMKKLNDAISKESNILGKGFRIGHSYFCTDFDESNKDKNWFDNWYKEIIRMDIEPLLEEYWFDEPEERKKWIEQLLSLIEK